jgi:hypothetical protein
MIGNTPEQVLKEEQFMLGVNQGVIYNTIKNNVFWIDIKWKEYKIQFANRTNIDVLEDAASFYFYMIRQIMIDDILLHICKITSSIGKKYPYLSIRRLPDLVEPQYRDSLVMLIDNALQKAKFAEDRRNRYIAHYSLDLVLNKDARPLENVDYERIEAAILSLKKVIIYIYEEIMHSGISSEAIYPLENANALVQRLRNTV